MSLSHYLLFSPYPAAISLPLIRLRLSSFPSEKRDYLLPFRHADILPSPRVRRCREESKGSSITRVFNPWSLAGPFDDPYAARPKFALGKMKKRILRTVSGAHIILNPLKRTSFLYHIFLTFHNESSVKKSDQTFWKSIICATAV